MSENQRELFSAWPCLPIPRFCTGPVVDGPDSGCSPDDARNPNAPQGPTNRPGHIGLHPEIGSRQASMRSTRHRLGTRMSFLISHSQSADCVVVAMAGLQRISSISKHPFWRVRPGLVEDAGNICLAFLQFRIAPFQCIATGIVGIKH